MAAMEETTFSVRTDTENDALLVPDGIETVLVNESAQRVIIPEGVEVVRLQTATPSSNMKPRSPVVHDESTDTPHWLSDAVDPRSRSRSRSSERTEPVERVKREVAVSAAPPSELTAERSLSLPSVPASPPASPDQPAASAERSDEPDLFEEVALRPSAEAAVVRQQPSSNGSARPAELVRQPLVTPAGLTRLGHGHSHSHGHSHMQQHWREQFQLEHEHSRPMSRQLGRFCADVMCCWLGV